MMPGSDSLALWGERDGEQVDSCGSTVALTGPGGGRAAVHCVVLPASVSI